MEVIRTSLAYYNGHEFIKEQIDSIINQQGLGAYTSEIVIYDDGSSEDSISKLKKIMENYSDISLRVDGKNKNPFFRYLESFIDAEKDGVKYLFWADQDDTFSNMKYIRHISKHVKSMKSMVITGDNKWFYISGILEPRTWKNARGHNFSFDMKSSFIKSLNLCQMSKMLEQEINNEQTITYHDNFIKFIFTPNNEVEGDWENITANHRVHSESITNSGDISSRPWKIWADEYNYYFKLLKPWYSKIVGEELSIKQYNDVYVFYDDHQNAATFKAFLDSFAMRLRFKHFRNMVSYSFWLLALFKSKRNKK